jgi:glycosyltransferase involved in cell wall biosynthesis
MRVTMVIAGLTGGGAERVAVNLANAWVGEGREVTLLTLSQRGAPAYELDPRVVWNDLGWPRQPRPDELKAESIAPVVRGLQSADCGELLRQAPLMAILRDAILGDRPPDVVVSHIDMTNLRVLGAMHETRIPVVVCEHTDVRRTSIGRWQRARGKLYRRAAAVVAPHEAIARWFAQRDAHAVAIANPLVAPQAIPRGEGGRRRRLVTLTRLSPEKRVELLVGAFAAIAADHPEWDLDIWGNGPGRANIERQIAAASTAHGDLAGRVRLAGFTSDPYAVLHEADLFASTSRLEGFGNAIWEALACGVPVVAMECGEPVSSLVRDGVDGIIVRRQCTSALAMALGDLMGDETKRRRYAANAPDVLRRFPMEESLRSWRSLLDSVCDGEGVARAS